MPQLELKTKFAKKKKPNKKSNDKQHHGKFAQQNIPNKNHNNDRQ